MLEIAGAIIIAVLALLVIVPILAVILTNKWFWLIIGIPVLCGIVFFIILSSQPIQTSYTPISSGFFSPPNIPTTSSQSINVPVNPNLQGVPY
jgi:hypothetical protein